MFGRNKPDQPQQAQDGVGAEQVREVRHDDPFAAIAHRLSALEQAHAGHLAALTDQLGDKDRTLAAMNDAVSASRRDQVTVLLAPAARKLIDLEHQARNAADNSRVGTDPTQTSGEFEFFAEKVLEVLDSLGFEEIECGPGTPFDPRQHEAAKTVPTDDPALDRTVATVLRPGFRFAGATKTTFPVNVIVHGYSAHADSAAATTRHKEN